jgi:hypothetical protein
MSNVQNILNESAFENRRIIDENKSIVSKWEKTGLLEGLGSEYEKNGMAILLENQAKELIKESNAVGTAANAEQWSGVALPLVRRIFAEIAAKDFVSVQPMNLPSGLVFYLDFKYGSSRPGFNSSANASEDPTTPAYQNNSLYGQTNSTADANGGLYGAGRFGYSVNTTAISLSATGSAVYYAANPTTSAKVTALSMLSDADSDMFNYDSNFTNAYSASIANGDFKSVKVVATSITGADLNGVRSFTVSGSTSAVVAGLFPQFTKYDGSTVTFVVSGSIAATGAGNTIALSYSKQPVGGNNVANTRGDFEDQDGSTNLNIPELKVEMRSTPIVAKTRKLKAVWSPEFAQDLNAYHAIDAEAELTSMLSEYISQEIDLEILDMLIQNAVTNENWSAKVGYEYSSATDTFGFTNSNYALAYNQGTWFQTLGTKIQKVSNKIHQKTLRGGANFLVCSPAVATILESIPGYAADTNGDKMSFAMGVQKVGALNNRFTVYKNPYMTENTILMGYRGAQFLETGAVYAPYIPLIMTPLVYDPNNFTPRKGVMTRYAKQMVRPEFYGTVKVHGLDIV